MTSATAAAGKQPSSFSYVSSAEKSTATTNAPNLPPGYQASDFFRVPFQDSPDKVSTTQAVSNVSAFSKPTL